MPIVSFLLISIKKMKRAITTLCLLIIFSQISYSKYNTHSHKEEKSTATSFYNVANCKKLQDHPDTLKVSASRLIIPGKSIGRTAINQKMSVVLKKLGKPTSSDASMGGHTMCIWYSKPKISGKDTLINETDIYFYTKNFGEANAVALVDHIRITSSYFRTAENIGVGTSLDKIQNKFPGAILQSSEPDAKTGKIIDTYYDEKKGIAFDLIDGKCAAVTVYRTEN